MYTRVKLARRNRVCGGLALAGKGKKRAYLHAGVLQELREWKRIVFYTRTQTEQLKMDSLHTSKQLFKYHHQGLPVPDFSKE